MAWSWQTGPGQDPGLFLAVSLHQSDPMSQHFKNKSQSIRRLPKTHQPQKMGPLQKVPTAHYPPQVGWQRPMKIQVLDQVARASQVPDLLIAIGALAVAKKHS